jgi:hypothetical protein
MANSFGGTTGRCGDGSLPEQLLSAFYLACDFGDLIIADRLLITLETLLARRRAANPNYKGVVLAEVLAAHERLWGMMKDADGQ